jgi:hypothetical protein
MGNLNRCRLGSTFCVHVRIVTKPKAISTGSAKGTELDATRSQPLWLAQVGVSLCENSGTKASGLKAKRPELRCLACRTLSSLQLRPALRGHRQERLCYRERKSAAAPVGADHDRSMLARDED